MCQQLTFYLSLDFKYSLYIQELKEKLKVLQEKSTEGIGEKELELIDEKYINLMGTELGLAEGAENIKKSERKIDRTETRREGQAQQKSAPKFTSREEYEKWRTERMKEVSGKSADSSGV